MINSFEDEDNLWTEYWRSRDDGSDSGRTRLARNELIKFYAIRDGSLLPKIARRMIFTMGLNTELLPDIINDGILPSTDNAQEGLVYAIEHYEPERNVPFDIYAKTLIKRAILHGRTAKPNPTIDIRALRFTRLCKEFEAVHHQRPTIMELSRTSGISEKVLEKMKMAAAIYNSTGLEEYFNYESDDNQEKDIPDGNGSQIEITIIEDDDDDYYRKLFSGLREKDYELIPPEIGLNPDEITVLYMRYYLGLSNKEIAEKMAKQEGAIRQDHFRGTEKFRKYLRKIEYNEQ